MTSPVIRRLLALNLAIATSVVAGLAPAAAADNSTLLTGRVMENDGFTPREGVVVALVDQQKRLVYRSEPTGDEGSFQIDSAPAGDYRLLAETQEGAFLASDRFTVKSGANDPVALKLTPSAKTSNVTLAPGQVGAETSWWQWAIAGGIVVAGLIVVSDASSSDEPLASPSN
jgi:hypothetical protein